MLSRTSQAAAELLSGQSLLICRKCMLSPTLRRYDVFLRSNSQQSEPESQPHIPRNRRTHRRKLDGNKRQRGTKVPISVTSLGGPTEVLLVKDRKRRQFPGEVKGEKSADESSLSLMLGDVEASELLADEDLVTENIESFRRYKPGDKLSVDEWSDLRQDIWRSFTNKQMTAYIYKSMKNEKEAALEHGKEVSSKWRPGVSTLLDSADVHDAIRVTRSQDVKAKDLLVETILRDCWKLGIAGETGQLDYQLSPPLLSLLVQSDNFSFEVLASLHNAQVDLNHSLGLVRITGNQKACESLRDTVHDATSRVRQEDIQLYSQGDPRANASNCLSNREFLSWVSTTYGVAFEQHASIPSKMFYLAENKQGADDARRTINLAIYDTTVPQASFGTYVSASESIQIHDFNPEGNTVWWNREKPWFRWSMPSAQSASTEVLQTPFFDNHEIRLSEQLLKLLREKSYPKVDQDDGAGLRETVSAAVGRCLFLRKPSLVDESVNANQLGRLAAPRTFNTDIPQVASILRMLPPRMNSESVRCHRINLVPSMKYADVLPPIDVDFKVEKIYGGPHPVVKVRLQSAKAVLSKSNVDYLLPENGLDLRFTRKLTRELLRGPGAKSRLENLQSSLQDVFSKARTNREDKPLPAFIDLSLSNAVLHNFNGSTESSGETAGEYIFLPAQDIQGTRIHRYKYGSHDLHYSYFESGPYYAHRSTDFFLDMDITKGLSDSSTDELTERHGDFESFYKAACALAFDVDKAWRTRPASYVS